MIRITMELPEAVLDALRKDERRNILSHLLSQASEAITEGAGELSVNVTAVDSGDRTDITWMADMSVEDLRS